MHTHTGCNKLTGIALIATSAVLALSGTASAAPPPTPLRQATIADMTANPQLLDFGWFSALDPHGLGMFQLTFLEHGFAGTPATGLALNLNDPAGNYSNNFDIPAAPMTTTDAPSFDSKAMHFGWDESKQAWHLMLNDLGTVADLYYTKTQRGAAMDPVDWDGQKVYWAASLGTAKVNGTIKFPGHTEVTKVENWDGEQERMAGTYLLGPGHIGYDYAQAGNPDGSADELFMFPQLNGTTRGILAHTAADGTLTMCEPKDYTQENWDQISMPKGHIGTFPFPRTVSASCDNLSITFTVETPHLFPLLAQLTTTTMSQGHTNVPGSRATIQHLRNVGTGYTTGFPLTGLAPTEVPSLFR